MPSTITSAVHLLVLAFAVCASLVIRGAIADGQTVIYSVVNETVRLSCPLPRSRPARIEWFDSVHNNDRNPTKIFTAQDNRRTMESRHPNRKNFEVDANFTLFIRDVRLDDTGAYNCTSKINNTFVLMKSYYLAVSESPRCNESTTMLVGQESHFVCEFSFLGNFLPQVEWRRGSDTVWKSQDSFDIRLARKEFDLEAKAGDDGRTFICRMTFGDIIRECQVNITVLYTVRDLVIDPHKVSYAADEEIRCAADGNPTPSINFQPPLTPGKNGVGWRSATIPKSLTGQKTEVECIASNTVDGRKEEIRKTISFTVTSSEKSNGFDNSEKNDLHHIRSESASSSGAIVGGIVVGIMILLIVVAAVFCVRLRKEKKPKKEENGGAKTSPTSRDSIQGGEKENQV